MQCNPPFFIANNGPQNQYSNYAPYNPFGTTFQPQCQQYPEVIGEGEVTTVILPDGNIQLYFLPVTRWNAPFANTFNGCNRCRNGAVWFVRSVSDPSDECSRTPHPIFNIHSQCQTPLGSNFAIQPPPPCQRFTFHNDAWTSSTDLKYFCPLRRPCDEPPKTCAGCQNSATTENKSAETEVNPNNCPSCGGDSTKKERQVDCKCSSYMSIEENKSKRRHKSKDKKRKSKRSSKRKKDKKYSSSDSYSSTDCSDSYMSISSSSKSKNKSKKGKKCQDSSTTFYSSASSLDSRPKRKSKKQQSDTVICECRETQSKCKTKSKRKRSKTTTCESCMSIQTDQTRTDNNTQARGQCGRSSNTSIDSKTKKKKSKESCMSIQTDKTRTDNNTQASGQCGRSSNTSIDSKTKKKKSKESCMSIQTDKTKTDSNTQARTLCGCSSNTSKDSRGILRSTKKKPKNDKSDDCDNKSIETDKGPKSSKKANHWGVFSRFSQEKPKEKGIIIRDDPPSQNFKCQTSELITSDKLLTTFADDATLYNDKITPKDSKQDEYEVICPCDEGPLENPNINTVLSTCAKDMEMWLSKWAHEFADAGKRKIDETIDSCCKIRIDEID